MEFAFEADPHLDIALGMESVSEVETFETEQGVEEWDLSGYVPTIATEAKPGSEDKVKMLSARYAAGVPLWDPKDCYDHGPDQIEAALASDDSVFIEDDAPEASEAEQA